MKKEDKDASPKGSSSRGRTCLRLSDSHAGRKRLVRTDLVELVPKGEGFEESIGVSKAASNW